MTPLLVSTQVAAVGLAEGGSGVVVVPVEAVGVDVDGADVAGPEVDGAAVTGAEVDGSDVAGAEVGGSDVDGLTVGAAVAAVVVPPPQAQHMSSSVKPAVSNAPNGTHSPGLIV